MALSADSKICEIMKNPKAVEMMEKYSPGISKSSKIKLVQNFTLRDLSNIPKTGITNEQVEEFDKHLRTIKD